MGRNLFSKTTVWRFDEEKRNRLQKSVVELDNLLEITMTTTQVIDIYAIAEGGEVDTRPFPLPHA